MKLPPSRRAAAGVLERAGCPRICLPARGDNSSGFLTTAALWVCGGDAPPFHFQGRVLTGAVGRRSADTGRPRIRLAPPDTGDWRRRNVLSQERLRVASQVVLFGADFQFPLLTLNGFPALVGSLSFPKRSGCPSVKGKVSLPTRLRDLGPYELPICQPGRGISRL